MHEMRYGGAKEILEQGHSYLPAHSMLDRADGSAVEGAGVSECAKYIQPLGCPPLG